MSQKAYDEIRAVEKEIRDLQQKNDLLEKQLDENKRTITRKQTELLDINSRLQLSLFKQP